MPETTVIRASRLLDGAGRPAQPDGAVVLVDGAVAAAGSAGALALPSGAGVTRRDYPDCTLLPGLIDAHTHLLFSAGERALDDALGDSDETLLLRGLANAQAELRCGVTTLRDCGGRGFLTLALRDAVRRGIVVGPRILASAMPVTTTGGHLNFCGLEADGTPEVVKATRRLCKAGVDFIKVMATGGGMTPGTNPRAAQYSVEELAAIVAEARRLGHRHVAAHCHATVGIARSVEAGIATIEHCSWLGPDGGYDYDDALVDRMVERGTYVSWTMGGERAAVKRPEQASRWDEHFALRRQMLRPGLRFVASSDAGVAGTYFEEYPLTVEVLVACIGVSPAEALLATTGRAAEAIGLAEQVGTLQPGRRGDVLVVEGDPLADVRALRRVRAVYRDGALLVEDGKLVSWGARAPGERTG